MPELCRFDVLRAIFTFPSFIGQTDSSQRNFALARGWEAATLGPGHVVSRHFDQRLGRFAVRKVDVVSYGNDVHYD